MNCEYDQEWINETAREMIYKFEAIAPFILTPNLGTPISIEEIDPAELDQALHLAIVRRKSNTHLSERLGMIDREVPFFTKWDHWFEEN